MRPRNIHVVAAAPPRPSSEEDLHGRTPRRYEAAYVDDVDRADASFANRGYRYYGGPHISYPFGHGLVYGPPATLTNATPAPLRASVADVSLGTLALDVTATEEDVVQLYAVPRGVETGARLPSRVLVDFRRVSGNGRVSFDLAVAQLALVDATGVRRAFPGRYDLVASTGDPRGGEVVVGVVLTA